MVFSYEWLGTEGAGLLACDGFVICAGLAENCDDRSLRMLAGN